MAYCHARFALLGTKFGKMRLFSAAGHLLSKHAPISVDISDYNETKVNRVNLRR